MVLSNYNAMQDRLRYRAYAELYRTNTLDEWIKYKEGVMDTLYALNSENVFLQEPYWSTQLHNMWEEKERERHD